MRFRIEITKRDDVWVVDIFDLHDHGTDIAFASVSGPDLDVVMRHTSHYVFVASVDDESHTFMEEGRRRAAFHELLDEETRVAEL